ncbi:MAG TPA: nucleotidyltransferase family protein [Sandaracinaceae bacterium LLY-WYZ-13_1]|nr:nucleotidyltransferase family protein [Sandaracinaceae bacterium LLY-WYZ-13_1]
MTLASRFGHTERLAAALVARHDLAAAVRILNEAGVIPMPLKGVLLQHVVYQDPADRMLSDADLLAPPGRFGDAIAALRAAGHRVSPEGRAGCATQGPDARLEVDVHRRVFPPGLYALPGRQMFARGRIDETLFDGVVVVPAPLDVYAHLVGNFAKGRHVAGDLPQLRDFSAVASRFALSPPRVARHLVLHGLARAARYTLAHAAEGGDAFAAEVLRALPTDRVGQATAAAARRLATRYEGSPWSLVAPHLVNRTLPRGAASAVAHVALGLRSRIETRLKR